MHHKDNQIFTTDARQAFHTLHNPLIFAKTPLFTLENTLKKGQKQSLFLKYFVHTPLKNVKISCFSAKRCLSSESTEYPKYRCWNVRQSAETVSADWRAFLHRNLKEVSVQRRFFMFLFYKIPTSFFLTRFSPHALTDRETCVHAHTSDMRTPINPYASQW